MKKILFTLALLLTISLTYGRTLTSNGNGDWDIASSWTPAFVPGSSDTIIVQTGDIITVTCNCGTYTNVLLQVYGTLEFNNGKKLRFDSPTTIEVYTGGTLQGNNPGSKLIIDGNTVYRGRTPLNGPQLCDGSGCSPNGALPIQLLSFDVELKNNIATVKWTTISELNNSHFNIEVTKKNGEWEIFARVEGNGNSTIERNYETSFEYNESYGYVRLVQYDYDGTREAFNIVYMKSDNIDKEEWLNVFSLTGREVSWRNGLTPGIYIVQFSGGIFKHIQH